jgi:hypothetical protein
MIAKKLWEDFFGEKLQKSQDENAWSHDVTRRQKSIKPAFRIRTHSQVSCCSSVL